MKRRIPWWVWASVVPLGLGAWATLVPARQLKRRSWVVWSALWCAVTAAGWVLAGTTADNSGLNDAAGGLIILGWVGAVATALSIRPAYLQAASDPFELSKEAAARRLAQRQEAQRMARQNPELAEELGVGRPDRAGAQAAGLVDVNNAPATALATLPGVDDALARRIVRLRERIDGFESLEDFGTVMDLDGNAVERLREHTVFLPR
jgi:DNA uptake protein ComE-like DNA-binding protein